jgi:nicotinamide-nucleotide amidase
MVPPRLLELARIVLEAARRPQPAPGDGQIVHRRARGRRPDRVPGSSDVFDRGFVTYSNAAKTDQLGVPAALITAHGAVSERVARAMAKGALARSAADIAVAITGIAGPGGGSVEKPVGLVHFAVARRCVPTQHLERRYGDKPRSDIRLAAVEDALALIKSVAS